MSSVPAMIIMTHMTFLFSQFTQIITYTLPTLIPWPNPILQSLHLNLPAALFIYCIWAYHVHAHATFLPLACTCNCAFHIPTRLLIASVLFTLQANQCSPSCIHCHITFNSLHIPPIPAQVNTCSALLLCDFWQMIPLFLCLSKFIRHTPESHVSEDIPIPDCQCLCQWWLLAFLFSL